MVYGIGEIVKYGGRFAIFTATLPPFIKKLILKECIDADDKRKKQWEVLHHEIKECREKNIDLEGKIKQFNYKHFGLRNLESEKSIEENDYDERSINCATFTFQNHNGKKDIRNLRHHVQLLDGQMKAQDVIDKIKIIFSKLNDSKILIICNTVKQAQAFYEKLMQFFFIAPIGISCQRNGQQFIKA